MFLKLFLIQKEAGGRVSFLKKVFSSLGKAVAEVLVLVSIRACALCLRVRDMGWDCPVIDTSLVLTCIDLTQIIPCK